MFTRPPAVDIRTFLAAVFPAMPRSSSSYGPYISWSHVPVMKKSEGMKYDFKDRQSTTGGAPNIVPVLFISLRSVTYLYTKLTNSVVSSSHKPYT